MSVLVSQCVPLCVLDRQERAKCRTFFPSGVYSLFRSSMLMLKRLRSVPLMGGGPQGPSVSRSPGAAPQKKAGRPMGPSTPLCYPQSFLDPLCFGFQECFGKKGLCLGFLFRMLCFGEMCLRLLSPSSFGPCFALLFWFAFGFP